MSGRKIEGNEYKKTEPTREDEKLDVAIWHGAIVNILPVADIMRG
jgi:hypothetical protein